MKTKWIASAALLAVVAAADVCSAYNTHGEWGSNNVTMRASSVSFPVGSSYRTALSNVVSRYFNNPSNMWFTQTWDDTSVGLNNGQNEVWFSSSSTYSPAVCYWWNSFWTGNINEADVVFYNGIAYTSSMNKTSLLPFGGSLRPFETTAAHEYGHAAGLLHEADEYNIMGSDWTHIHCNGSTCRSYVGEDAADGLVALYGANSGFQDVCVSLHKYLGVSGEYSTHQKCIMTNSAGSLLASNSFNGQRRYLVNNGQTVQVEFSFENQGASTQTVTVGFYVSTDSNITTADTRIATRSLTLSVDNVLTSRSTVTLPSNLVSGTTRYLGAIIDYNNVLAEVDSSNNAAYHIIQVN